MQTFLPEYILIPALLALLQTFLLLWLAIFVLRQLKWIQVPYSGMEYGQLLSACGALLGVLLISMGNLPSVFTAARVFHDQHLALTEQVFFLFTRFFLVLIMMEMLYVLLVFFIFRFLFHRELAGGQSIPEGLLKAVLLIGLAFLCWIIEREWITVHTPVWMNLN